jgi:polysaccharide pyruvyl transferase WcaK-like protein
MRLPQRDTGPEQVMRVAERIGLWFAHGTRNVGDVALNAGLVGLLESVGRELDVAVIPRGAQSTHAAARASLHESTTLVAMERAAMSADALIEYCGHPERLFRHYGLESVDTVLLHAGEHLYSPANLADMHPLALWRMVPALAAIASGRRAIQLPSTFGPFLNRAYRAVVGDQLRSLDAVAARDALSARVVADEFALTVPALLDPAFFVQPPTTPVRREQLTRAAISMRLEGFGLRAGSASSTERMQSAIDDQFVSSSSFAAGVAAAVELASSESLQVITVIAQTSTDIELCRAITQAVRERARESIAVDFVDAHEFSPRQLQSLIAEHDLLVTSRFHGSVLALAAGVPAVGIPLASHGHKIPGLYSLLEAPGWQRADGFDDPATVRALLADAQSVPQQDAVRERVRALRTTTSGWMRAALEADRTSVARRARRARRALARLAALARERRDLERRR